MAILYIDPNCLDIKLNNSTSSGSSGSSTGTSSDNGHCSTCQFHDTKSSCLALETFEKMADKKGKKYRGKTVDNNETDIQFKKTKQNKTATDGYAAITVTKDKTKINAQLWKNVKTILTYIKNYGTKGTRNPTQTKINNVNANVNDTIFLDDYNEILTALDKSIIDRTKITDTYPAITADLINKLQEYIQNYNLNTNRCNICNENCENCQTSQGGGGCDDPAVHCNCDVWCDCSECFSACRTDCDTYYDK